MARSMGIVVPRAPAGLRLPPARITTILVIVNAIVYVITTFENGFLAPSEKWLSLYSLIPILLIDPSQWYRILTSMFLHGGLFHIFFNMLYLYNFGKPVEAVIGSKRYLLLYMLSGFLAVVFHIAFISIEGPVAAVIPAIGASGAISGILGAYLLLFPGSKITMYFLYFYFPVSFTWRASAYLIFWFLMQVLQGYMGGSLGVAFFAHIGGFIGGLALLPYVMDKNRHRLIRMLTASRRYLYYVYFGHKGLGGFSKLILIITMVAIIAGAAYSALSLRGSTIPMRVLAFKVNYKVYDEVGSLLNAGFDEELVVIRIAGERVLLALPISSDSVRVLFNRLNALRLLYDKAKSGKILMNGTYIVKLLGFRLRASLRMEAVYDDYGFLSQAEGSITTDVLSCIGYRCIISGIGDYSFKVNTVYGREEGRRFEDIAIILAFSSLAFSILAVNTLIREADRLAIII